MFEITSVCNGGGYKYCRTNPLHPRANTNGLYPLHRVLMENKIGRLLKPDEVVHHKNGDKDDNSIENLEVMTNSQHALLHSRVVEDIRCICPVCGGDFTLRPHHYRARVKRRGGEPPTCSRRCGGLAGHRSGVE